MAAARAEDRRQREELRAKGSLLDHVEGAHVAEGKLLYAAEIRYVDSLVGRLLAAIPDDAVVIVVADHGESLDEHGYYFNHGALLHEPAIHVPLLVRWPGKLDDGRRVDELVGVTRIAPTLLSAAGLDAGGSTLLDGPSGPVLAWTSGQQNRRAASVGPGRRRRGDLVQPSAALRYDGAKLVSREAGPVEHFDLAADPGELAPDAVPQAMTSDAAKLRALMQEPVPGGTEDQRERLKALGYVE